MRCSNPDCNRGIGLVAYRRSWSSKRYFTQHCRDVFAADAPNQQQNQKNPVLKRFVVAFVARFVLACVAFVGLITMAVLAAPPARQDEPHLSGCARNLADASASVAAMQARVKSLSRVDASEICTATRLYFLEIVKARAMTAVCKSGFERDRELGRLDVDVEQANEAIAARCL